jgi:glycosyltransferase involved in cell wall biosynthesis
MTSEPQGVIPAPEAARPIPNGDLDIVLATWQGARFLPTQLASLADQTMPANRLLVSDDGSTDHTVECLNHWAATVAIPVDRLAASTPRVGAAGNFGRLLAATQAAWVAPCDQDDRWYPHKLARLRAAMTTDTQIPTLLVHDLALVNAKGDPIAPSFWRHQRFDPHHGSRFGTLLVMNSFPGCAMLANRALLDLALPIPPQAVMHDWWLALVAAACGRIIVVPEVLMEYRQHGGNAVGAPVASWWARLWQRTWPDADRQVAALRLALNQAKALRERALPMTPPARETLDGLMHAMAGPRWLRPWRLRRHGIQKTGFGRNLAFQRVATRLSQS